MTNSVTMSIMFSIWLYIIFPLTNLTIYVFGQSVTSETFTEFTPSELPPCCTDSVKIPGAMVTESGGIENVTQRKSVIESSYFGLVTKRTMSAEEQVTNVGEREAEQRDYSSMTISASASMVASATATKGPALVEVTHEVENGMANIDNAQIDRLNDTVVMVSGVSTPTNDENSTATGTVQTYNTTGIIMDPYNEEQPLWLYVMNSIQIGMVSVGFVTNVITFFVVRLCEENVRPVLLLMLKNQSISDAFVCVLGALLLVFPPGGVTGFKYVDVIICHVWHTQIVYWYFVGVSAYNLVLIAIDRFVATCYPFRYDDFTLAKVKICVAVIYCVNIVNVVGTVVQVTYNGNQCLFERLLSGKLAEIYYPACVIYIWLAIYGLPTTVLVALYGKTIYTLRMRCSQSQLGSSQVIEHASKQITKTGFVVTIIYVLTMGYDLNYYALSDIGVIVYELGAPIQAAGVFLSATNSVANPFVYALLLPIFRQGIRAMVCCRRATQTTDLPADTQRHGNVVATL